MPYNHFTLEERIRIQIGLETNKTRQEIADSIGKSRNAVTSEISRNSITLEIVTTSRVNKPRILTLDLRTRRGRGEVPDKEAARKRYQHRLKHWRRGQPAYDAEIAQELYRARRDESSAGNIKLEDGNPLAQRISNRLLSTEKEITRANYSRSQERRRKYLCSDYCQAPTSCNTLSRLISPNFRACLLPVA